MENFVNLKDRKSSVLMLKRLKDPLESILHNYLNLVKWRNLVKNYIFDIRAVFLAQKMI